MKKYIALTNILHNGKLVKAKEAVELSDDEASELKGSVELPKEDEKPSTPSPSAQIDDMKKVEEFVDQYLAKNKANGKVKSGDVMKEINLAYPGLLGNKGMKKLIEELIADKLG